MSILKKIFGFGTSAPKPSEPSAEEIYKTFKIVSTPIPAERQWRLAGSIIKIDGEMSLSRQFIRADLLASKEEADTFAFRKARQSIDEQGERLFKNGQPDGRV